MKTFTTSIADETVIYSYMNRRELKQSVMVIICPQLNESFSSLIHVIETIDIFADGRGDFLALGVNKIGVVCQIDYLNELAGWINKNNETNGYVIRRRGELFAISEIKLQGN